MRNKTRNYISICIVLFLVMLAPVAGATSYVTFNDGHLLVLPDECVQTVSHDDGSLTIVALDGSVFSYPMADIESISDTLPRELPSITSYKFTNKCNYQVYTDAVGVIENDTIRIEVAGIGKRLTATFSLSDNDAVAYVDGVLQQSKESRMRFAGSKVYTVCHVGDMVLKELEYGSYGLVPFGRDVVVDVDFLTDHSTSVPRIDINTVGGVPISSKEYYLDAEIIIDGAGVFPSMTDSVQVRGRGNDSWSTNPNSKNPYRLKFASKVKPFGMTKGKNWVLLANKRKGSMMTNAIGMKAASLIGTVAANHIVPVDLYVNGTYKGSYNFTEKVGFAGNSVDLDDETAAALLELDKYYDEAETQKFMSTPYDIPVNIKSPEFGADSTLLTLGVIQQRFNSFVADVYDGNDYTGHVDVDQLARFLMVNELILNREILHPKSTYCYNENILDPESRFVFGPVWDLDWAFGYDGSTAASYFVKSYLADFFNIQITQQPFYAALLNSSALKSRMYELWKGFKGDDLDELCEFCQDYYNYARPSFSKNKAAALDGTDYANQVTLAINWLRQRSEFIFEKLVAENLILGDVDGDGEVSISDVSVLVDYLLQGDQVQINLDNADVDGDGEVTISDVSALIDKLLGVE